MRNFTIRCKTNNRELEYFNQSILSKKKKCTWHGRNNTVNELNQSLCDQIYMNFSNKFISVFTLLPVDRTHISNSTYSHTPFTPHLLNPIHLLLQKASQQYTENSTLCVSCSSSCVFGVRRRTQKININSDASQQIRCCQVRNAKLQFTFEL